MNKSKLINAIRWVARILSLISIGIVLLFFIGEGSISEFAKLTIGEWILILFFPIGLMIGLFVSWWKELIGGIIAVGSIILFNIIDNILSGKLKLEFEFLVFAIPGILFILYWYLKNRNREEDVVL